MKALTVQQPWAWAIIHGGKNVENRTQLWKYRGPLAIHAGARWSSRGGESKLVRDAIAPYLTFGQFQRPVDPAEHKGRIAFRAIIGLVDLVDTHVADPGCCDSPWAEHEYTEYRPPIQRRDIVHLILENPRAVDPIDCPGRLGLWNLPADIEATL